MYGLQHHSPTCRLQHKLPNGVGSVTISNAVCCNVSSCNSPLSVTFYGVTGKAASLSSMANIGILAVAVLVAFMFASF